MATPGDPDLTKLRLGAIISAVTCGTFALLAFVFGSPLEFGIALALSAAWWIVDDFVVSMLKREHAACRQEMRAAPPEQGYESGPGLRFAA